MLVCEFCGNSVYVGGDGREFTRFTFVRSYTKRWAHEDCLFEYNQYVKAGYGDFKARFLLKHVALTLKE